MKEKSTTASEIMIAHQAFAKAYKEFINRAENNYEPKSVIYLMEDGTWWTINGEGHND